MIKDETNGDVDKELQGLGLFQPSMRFSKNVLEEVKAKTELVKPERGPVHWLPRVLIASTLAVIVLVFAVLLSRQSTLSEITLTDQMNQAVIIVSGTLMGLLLLLGMDWVLKKLVLD